MVLRYANAKFAENRHSASKINFLPRPPPAGYFFMHIEFTSPWILLNIPLFAAGLFVLVKGCGIFIDSAAEIARNFGFSETIIGLTLVSIGTSLPELGTNIYASLNAEGQIALANALGSNIANIGLILALAIVLRGSIPIFPPTIIRRDAMAMLLAFIIITVFSLSGKNTLGRSEGCVLLAIFLLYLGLLYSGRNRKHDDSGTPAENNNTFKNLLVILVGLAMISCGAKTMVDNVISTAEKMSVSKALITATVVAFGTSVPELAVTVTGILKGKNQLAIGNILGSCIFNVLMVMGVSSVLQPISAGTGITSIALPFMLGTGCLMTIFMFTGMSLKRIEGFVLLAIYTLFVSLSLYLS